jgi:DNA-binding MarR family transcriptional regulator
MDKRIIDYVFLLKKKCLLEEGEIGREVGLAPSEIHCIETIHPDERLSGNILSDRMGLSPSRGSRIIDHLIEKGLLSREIHPRDRRFSALSLTQKGKDMRRGVENAKRVCERKITNRMNEEQIRQIKMGLKKLVDVL